MAEHAEGVQGTTQVSALSRVDLDDLLAELRDRARALQSAHERLSALLDAVVAVATDLDLAVVLDRIVATARLLSHARVRTDDLPAEGRSVWIRLAGFLLVLAVGGAVVLLLPADSGPLREQVTGAGAWGWLLFLAAYVVATLMLLPKNVLSILAGLTYGATLGTVLVWVAAVLGASAAFWIGRALGRDGVARLAGPAMSRLDEWVTRRGALAVLVARLVPVLPFTAVNYASGLTVVGFVPYLLATAVGILPGTVAYVVLGAYGSDPGSWPFVAALSGLVLLAGGGLVWRQLARRRRA